MTNPAGSRVRWLTKGLLMLGRGLGVLLLATALLIVIREQTPWVIAEAGQGQQVWRGLLTATTLAAVLAGLWLWLFRPRPVVRMIGTLLVAMICGWSWLAWDDPQLDYPLENYLSASNYPEAQVTNDLVLRYRSGEDSRLPVDLPELHEPFTTNNKTPTIEQWTAFVSGHRAEIQQGWEQLAEHRAWVAELAAAHRLADLITLLSDPIPSFKDLRAPTRFMMWQARALALENRGDEALAEVTTLLEAGQKLAPESRTLVRRMIAVVLQKTAIKSADFVLSVSETSVESRLRLLTVLQSRENPVEGARKLVWSDYLVSTGALLNIGRQLDEDSLQGDSPYGHRIFFNPKATANLFGHYFDTLSDHAAARDFSAINTQQAITFDEPRSWRIKNLAGYLFLDMATPAFSKVIESYWETEDLAVALEARLQTP